MPVPPDYRIIYNWDGAPHGYSPAPQSMEEFLEKVYAPLEETQVDALFWSVGGQGSRWPSDVVEFIGQARERPYPSAGAYNATENILRMYDRGEDPQQALIDRGRELGLHVYASVRMNDNHFGGAQIADLEALRKAHRVEALRHEHPEWVLGEQTSEWFALSWNMAVPEIRERRFHHVEEVCRRYDWDGVELDWQRHAFHFPDGHGYRLRYLLTDLQRAVRRMTEALGRERGRPVFLAARVAGSLEMCRRIGYDVPAWVKVWSTCSSRRETRSPTPASTRRNSWSCARERMSPSIPVSTATFPIPSSARRSRRRRTACGPAPSPAAITAPGPRGSTSSTGTPTAT